MSSMTFKIKSKSLTFGDKSYTAISGPFEHGALPTGSYEVKTRNAVNKGLKTGFTAGGASFFIPIEPLFNAGSRKGLGIHPDGNKPGTLGCIGISAEQSLSFYKAWMALPVGSRPTRLLVLD